VRALLFTLLMSLAGCANEGEVLVDAFTDLVPGRDFDTIRVGIASSERTYPADRYADWLRGVRLGPLGSPSGPQVLIVTMTLGGNPVLDRRISLSVAGTVLVPVWLLRSCLRVECPEPGGDRSLTECADGRCVAPDCVDGVGTGCPAPVCDVASDCPLASVPCAVAACREGHCVIEPRPGACPAGMICDPGAGCVEGPPDAGMIDAGADVPAMDAPRADTPAAGCVNPCNDRDPCTFNDTCVGSRCVGDPVDCTSDTCADRTCNGTSACTVTIHTGRTCEDDGDECTRDQCGAGGNCRHYDRTGGEPCSGGICCGGACVPEDDNNCGGCGVRCTGGLTCSGGSCTCGGASCGGVDPACCGGRCSDLDSDFLNCGACGAPRCGDQFGDCIGGSCICGTDGRCPGGSNTCCRCGAGGMGSYCAPLGTCPC
jgi:hypothetical protein